MEVTIWIERSLDLHVTRRMPDGSTIGELKSALLSEDIFGSLSVEELILALPGCVSSILDDSQQITEALAELELRPPGEGDPTQDSEPLASAVAGPEEVFEEEGRFQQQGAQAWDPSPGEEPLADLEWSPDQEQPAQEGQSEAYPQEGWADEQSQPGGEWSRPPPVGPRFVPGGLPKALGTELKWYAWNTMWYATNLQRALKSEDSEQTTLKLKAGLDLERSEKHLQGVQALGLLSEEALQTLRKQAECAGRAAADAYLDGSPFQPDAMEVLVAPAELDGEVWTAMLAAMRQMAQSSTEMALFDLAKDQPQLQYMHWLKSQEAQKSFEQIWHALYDSPPTPPPENPPPPQEEDSAKPSRAEQEEAARRQAEVERKAFEMKDGIKKTATGAQKLLGNPLAYMVMRDCPVYKEPMPQAGRSVSVSAGMKLWGYPGSAAWIKIDGRVSGLPTEAWYNTQAWVPVRSQEGAERGLVLHALWHELQAEKTLATSLEVKWPGVGQPVEPNVAEYTLEVRARDDPGQNVSVVVSGTTKTKATVRDLLPLSDVQLRLKLRIVGPYSVDFRLSGPWADFRTAEESLQQESTAAVTKDPTEACEEVQEGEGEGIYQVVHSFVTLRGEPSTKGTILGTLKQGACIYGVPFQVAQEPWIKLSPQTIPAAAAHMPPRDISAADSVFVLVDAASVPSLKLGVLLKRIGDGGASDENRKLGEWQVVYDKVVVREKPTVDAVAMGFHKKGSKVLGVCLPVGGQDWLRVQNPDIQGVQSPDAWMLVDGQSLGLGQLLKRLQDAPPSAHPRKSRALPKSTMRPPPPRPLTVPWVAVHGGLPCAPRDVRETPLDADLDVGMASMCSLLHVRPADGGSERSFVAKRGPEFGDMNSCSREYRFYSEIARSGIDPSSTEPSVLGDVMRVPRCHCANWGKEGKEREGFILILERLDEPDWVPVDPELGCTHEQAIIAIETLGRMHKAFGSRTISDHKFDWLPCTVFDVRHAGHIQGYFTSILSSAKPLIQMLPPGAQATVERMAEGGLGECFERLAEPPLCLNHGDYRPENLRFSAPGRPQAVGVFDWGLVNVARGMADFAYFVMLSQPPEERRKRERELLSRYLEARGDGNMKMEEAWEDLKSASIAILGMILMTRHGVKSGGWKTGTRNMLSRMMRWVGEAITDWKSIEVVSSSYY